MPRPTQPARTMQDDKHDEEAPEEAWWRESSFELRRGLDVEDEPEATIPGELFDELIQQRSRQAPRDAYERLRMYTVYAVNHVRCRAAIFDQDSRLTVIEWIGGCRPDIGDSVSGSFDTSRIVRLLNVTKDCVIDALVRATGCDPGSAEALLA